MSSKIDPSGINSAYPIASLNQSSQGFRDNFKAIKNALVQARTENTLILSTTISVSGQGIDPYTSSSIELSNGNIPLVLNVSSQPNVNPGDYDLKDQIISFTVNDKGVITSLKRDDDLPSYDTNSLWNITKTPDNPSYPGNSGIASITYPVFQTNSAGRVVHADTKTVDGFGLLGYGMPKGALLVGGSDGKSTFMPTGASGQVLSFDDNSPTGFSWQTPTYGTVTGIKAGLGLSVQSNSATPEIDLNINALPSNNDFGDDLNFLTYKGSHSITSWANLTAQMMKQVGNLGYIHSLSEDKNPKLTNTLDTNGYGIANFSGNPLNITSNSDLNLHTPQSLNISGDGGVNVNSTNLKLNGLQVPNNPPSQDNMVLASGPDGRLFWKPQSDFWSYTNGDNVIWADHNGKDVSLSFRPWNLGASSVKNTTMVMAVDKASSNATLVPVAQIIGAAGTPGVMFVSNQGDDNLGNGTMTAPYQTIQKAASVSPSGSIMLLPGSYDAGGNVFGNTISAFLEGTSSVGSNTGFQSCILNGIIFNGSPTFTSTTLNDCTLEGDICYSSTSATINNSNINCPLVCNDGSIVDIQNCTNSNQRYSEIRVYGGITRITSSSFFTIIHYDGSCMVDGLSFVGGVTSTASDNGSNVLTIRNSSLSANMADSGKRVEWYTIQKTGNCPFVLQNVARMASRDTLNGTRLEYSSTDMDIGGEVVIDNLQGDYQFNGITRYVDLTMSVDHDVHLSWVDSQYNTNLYVRDLTLILRGNNTNARVWFPSGVFFNDDYYWIATTPITVFHFIRTRSGWMCDYHSNDYSVKSITSPSNPNDVRINNIWQTTWGNALASSGTQGNSNASVCFVSGNIDSNSEKLGIRLKTGSDDQPVYCDLVNGQIRCRELALKSITDNLYSTKQDKGNYISSDYGKTPEDPLGVGLHTNNGTGRANYWDSTGAKGDLAYYQDVVNAINNIPISKSTNNLLRKTDDGYTVELVPAPDVSVQFVSSSMGNDDTGTGSRDRPFKTIRHALNRIPDSTNVSIYLYYQDTFVWNQEIPWFKPNVGLFTAYTYTYPVRSRTINFYPYGTSFIENLPPGVAGDAFVAPDMPKIQFEYIKTTDTLSNFCPGFQVNTGTLFFTQIQFEMISPNIPAGSYAEWGAAFALNNGHVGFNGCTFRLGTGVLFGSDGSNTATGTVQMNYYCYFDTTNGRAITDATCGYRFNLADFDLIGGNPILVAGKDSGYKYRTSNASAVMDSRSFIGLKVINQQARRYFGLQTDNNIVPYNG